MNNPEKKLAEPAKVSTESLVRSRWSGCLRVALGAIVMVGSCELLTTVWRVAGDESRRDAMAAVRSLERARTSDQRIDAIRDLIRPVTIDGRMTIPPLIESLANRALEVRVEAVRSLGPATSAVAALGRNDELVIAAIAALQTALDDPEPAVRIASVHTLGAIAASNSPSGVIHPQTVVDALSAMLNDADATVRASTIASLGFAGSTAATDPPRALFAALDDESSFNRAAAAHALARFATRNDD